VTSVAFGPGSRTLATGGADGTTRLWRVATGTVRAVLRARGRITEVAYSPRATLVATAGSDGVARVWRTASGDPVAVLSGHTNPITALAFSPDGTSVATASSDGTVRVWKALTGQPLALLHSPGMTVTGLAFNRTGALLAGAGADGRVRLWDARSQPTLLRYRDLQRPISRASWEPEGIRAITDDGAARIVRVPGTPTPGAPHDLQIRVVRNTVLVREGNRHLVLRGHTGAVVSVRADASGRRLVTASRDGSARIWDVSTGRSLHTLRHFRDVADAEFSPDGRWVVTAGPSTAAVWDARSGRRLFDLRGHTAPLVFASFDRSGRRIYTASEDGTIRRYECDVCASGDELVAFARARIARTGRTLTRAERLQLLGER
jgi:WD40 repeat protein